MNVKSGIGRSACRVVAGSAVSAVVLSGALVGTAVAADDEDSTTAVSTEADSPDEDKDQSNSSDDPDDKDESSGKEDNEDEDTSDDKELSGHVVAFGDSYFADSSNPIDGIGLSGCPQNKKNTPGLIAEKLGLPLKDYSCSGAVAYLTDTSPTGLLGQIPGVGDAMKMLTQATGQKVPTGPQTIDQQIDMAIKNGDLNEDTSVIPISIGGNDGMPQVLIPGNFQQDGFVKKMDEVFPRIQKAAPNATIYLVGYPKMSMENGGICAPVHMGLPTPELPVHLVASEETTINDYQKAAVAKHDGVEFVDIKEGTDGHGPCADDENRWVSGAVDATVDSTYAMPLHLTAKANEFISGAVVDTIEGNGGDGEDSKSDSRDRPEGASDDLLALMKDRNAGDSDSEDEDNPSSSKSDSGSSDSVRREAEDRVSSESSSGEGFDEGSGSSAGSDSLSTGSTNGDPSEADREKLVNSNRDHATSGKDSLG